MDTFLSVAQYVLLFVLHLKVNCDTRLLKRHQKALFFKYFDRRYLPCLEGFVLDNQ